MQDHQYSFEVDASPEEVWSVFWGKKTGDVMEHGNLRIEILHGGNECGEGPTRQLKTRLESGSLEHEQTRSLQRKEKECVSVSVCE